MDSSDIIALEEMLATSLTLEDKTPSEEILCSITHYFRELRTLCAKGMVYQDTVAESNIIQHTTEILSKLIKDHIYSEHALVCIRVGIQFMGNFVVDNPKNKNYVWQHHKLLLRNLLSVNDCKASNYSAMVIYNILKDNQNNINTFDIQPLFPAILDATAKESEFGLFCLEHLISWPGLLVQFYGSLGLGERLFLLEVSREVLSRGTHLPAEALVMLASEFKRRADAIFMVLGSQSSAPEPTESAALLETIATASGLGDSLAAQELKADGSLLTSAVFLLRGVHQCFAVEEKITAMDPLGSRMPELRLSPAYGFKAQLVRLIGNLCWQNRVNQDKVREIEGIELLLNCSRLDASNPFITQWVVLAIRNLCEHNLENQALVAALQREGDAPLNSVFRLKPDTLDASKMNVLNDH